MALILAISLAAASDKRRFPAGVYLRLNHSFHRPVIAVNCCAIILSNVLTGFFFSA
ncbi:hypothetical protein [Serratia odorifera]|uniref:hypothetical protein n=1 Tax=Serratia odorifera TaxID=618 RepID=UPI000304CF4D|nr:hypothetical protein [Serratia odorifera]MBJ2066337.1 hypothetical protein [Serratia odorifera]HEJ9095885.1 hypothetical protein [Serratia odorifera]